MLLFSGGRVSFDYDMEFLKEISHVLDTHIAKLWKEGKLSGDPDGEGYLDRLDFLSGVGFVACQQYIDNVCADCEVEKGIALDLGPRHRSGVSITAAVTAAANFWKHSSEWNEPSANPRHEKDRERIRDTFRVLGVFVKIGENEIRDDYPLLVMMEKLLTPLPQRFENLLPFLETWRDDVCDHGKQA